MRKRSFLHESKTGVQGNVERKRKEGSKMVKRWNPVNSPSSRNFIYRHANIAYLVGLEEEKSSGLH